MFRECTYFSWRDWKAIELPFLPQANVNTYFWFYTFQYFGFQFFLVVGVFFWDISLLPNEWDASLEGVTL